MFEWHYQVGKTTPAFILAADARLATTHYVNDQIWELVPGRSEPPAVTIQTTFGLRARALRIFPRFGINGEMVSDPAHFASALVIRQYGPAWIRAEFQPFEGLNVKLDFFIFHAQALSGRVSVTNTTRTPQRLRIELAGILSPAEGGERLHAVEMSYAQVLSGTTGNLSPLLYITGGPKPGSGAFPGLEQAAQLEPDESHAYNWVCAACPTDAESFALARKLVAQKIDEFLARAEMLDGGLLQVRTGSNAWNQAFSRAQITAYSLLMSPTSHLPNPSFVFTRQPDNGYSLRGDGSDYGPLWNGQTALGALYLAQFLLPTNPEIAGGILENFMAAQGEAGMDWKPGLGGQRGRYLVSPVLASLAWEIYQLSGDAAFLKKVFPALLETFRAWFLPQQDRDGDGVPEWGNPLQSSLEDHPVYSHWQSTAAGLDITTLESPDLLTFLAREGEILRRMAILIDQKDSLKFIQPRLAVLHKAVLECWHTSLSMFNPRDRDTHQIQTGEVLGEQVGPGSIKVGRKFRQPVRLRITIITPEEQMRRAAGSIRGSVAGFNPQKAAKASATEEALPPQRFRWRPGAGQSTSQAVFTQVEEVEIANIEPSDVVRVETVGHILQDISGLVPLWAAIPGEKQALEMCKQALMNEKRFGRPFGIPVSATAEDPDHQVVSFPWNMLVIQGLLAYGLRDEAAILISHLMEACTGVLKREGTFRRYYFADTGGGTGERGALEGLPPLGLFMEVLGVRVLTPFKVHISGENPFPWPVTVRYRGLTVLRQKEKTTVIFPDGQVTTVSGPGSFEVTL